MLKKRRAQVTVFMLLGIVILIIFGFLFYTSGTMDKIHLSNKANEIISNTLHKAVIRNYITGCLEKSTNDGLILIGKQGGVLYDYQIEGGSATGPNWFKYGRNVLPYNLSEVANVSYSIKRSQADPGKGYYWSKDYPAPNTKITDLIKENYFGNYYRQGGDSHISYLTPLCYESGPNQPSTRSCETYGGITAGGSIANIQMYLARFIEAQTKKCVDIDVIDDELGYKIVLEEPTAEVIIGEDDLIVNLIYVGKISIEGETPITKLVNYNINPQIRLKKIHELASRLIGYKDESRGIEPSGEVTDIFFDIERDYSRLGYWHNGMKVTKIKNVCDGLKDSNGNALCEDEDKFDNVINITDENSTINGKAYEFLFAVENRQPVLDLIQGNSRNDINFDFKVIEGGRFSFESVGFDPDEDYYTTVQIPDDYYNKKVVGERFMDPSYGVYKISGWKVDYDDKLKDGCCNKYEMDGVTLVESGKNCGRFSYCDCRKVEVLEKCMESIPISTKLSINGKDISYQTKKKTNSYNDMGYHKINVSVKDEAGLHDDQILKFLVSDIPFLEINENNYFFEEGGEIFNSKASTEDLFLLDAGQSNTIFNSGLIYKWELCPVSTGVCKILYQGDKPKVYLPCISSMDCSSYTNTNKETIIGLSDLRSKLLTTTGNKKLKLSVYDGSRLLVDKWFKNSEDSSNADPIIISNCLWYDNPRGNYAPYPYNKVPDDNYDNIDDPFLADHVCCKNDGNMYGTSQICYNYVSYGKIDSFTKNLRLGGFSATFSTTWNYFDENGNPQSSGAKPTNVRANNDIYKREFKRKCSGNRGNICSGAMVEVYEVVGNCDDRNFGTGERCEGPPTTLSGEVLTSISCQQYDETTFEKEFLGGSYTGMCNSAGKCTNGNSYSTPGPYWSDGAKCSGGGCDKVVNARCVKGSCEASCASGSDCRVTSAWCGDVKFTNGENAGETCASNQWEVVTTAPSPYCDIANDCRCKATSTCYNHDGPDLNNKYSCEQCSNRVTTWIDAKCCGDDSNEDFETSGYTCCYNGGVLDNGDVRDSDVGNDKRIICSNGGLFFCKGDNPLFSMPSSLSVGDGVESGTPQSTKSSKTCQDNGKWS